MDIYFKSFGRLGSVVKEKIQDLLDEQEQKATAHTKLLIRWVSRRRVRAARQGPGCSLPPSGSVQSALACSCFTPVAKTTSGRVAVRRACSAHPAPALALPSIPPACRSQEIVLTLNHYYVYMETVNKIKEDSTKAGAAGSWSCTPRPPAAVDCKLQPACAGPVQRVHAKAHLLRAAPLPVSLLCCALHAGEGVSSRHAEPSCCGPWAGRE